MEQASLDSKLQKKHSRTLMVESKTGKSVAEKALCVNLIRPLYGSIAEIGAGQEVARWFFKVGGAAGTIAKAMSAYDMSFSNDIYGKEDSGRYVVESRLRKMLDYEYSLLKTRLSEPSHGEKKYFFAFANTVAAKSFKHGGLCHGWVGMKFQKNPQQSPSQVILHVQMLDKTNLQQQETLGILGVNFIYACYHHTEDISLFLSSLLESEIGTRIEINQSLFEGPLFEKVQPTPAHVKLLEGKLTHTILLPCTKNPTYIGEELYDRQILIQREDLNPKKRGRRDQTLAAPIETQLDILKSARDHYCREKTQGSCDPYPLMTLNYGTYSTEGLQEAISNIQKYKQNILVTALQKDYQLCEYLSQFTQNPIGFVYRAHHLIHFFENNTETSLEQMTRIFNDKTRVYIYPSPTTQVRDSFHKNPQNPLFTLSDYKPSPRNKFLFQHLVFAKYLQELKNFNPSVAHRVESPLTK